MHLLMQNKKNVIDMYHWIDVTIYGKKNLISIYSTREKSLQFLIFKYKFDKLSIAKYIYIISFLMQFLYQLYNIFCAAWKKLTAIKKYNFFTFISFVRAFSRI